jgi:hypothetical protein
MDGAFGRVALAIDDVVLGVMPSTQVREELLPRNEASRLASLRIAS